MSGDCSMSADEEEPGASKEAAHTKDGAASRQRVRGRRQRFFIFLIRFVWVRCVWRRARVSPRAALARIRVRASARRWSGKQIKELREQRRLCTQGHDTVHARRNAWTLVLDQWNILHYMYELKQLGHAGRVAVADQPVLRRGNDEVRHFFSFRHRTPLALESRLRRLKRR